MLCMKAYDRTPYWFFLKPLFAKYHQRLVGKPSEIQVQKVVKNWLLDHNIELTAERKGLGLDIIDFEFYFQGELFGLEVKGARNSSPHNTLRILRQLQRYLQHYKRVILLVHSPGLTTVMRTTLAVSPIKKKVILLNLRYIDSLEEVLLHSFT